MPYRPMLKVLPLSSGGISGTSTPSRELSQNYALTASRGSVRYAADVFAPSADLQIVGPMDAMLLAMMAA